jgi:PKD repeat protein
LTYNFAGLYNATLKMADAPELQIGTFPAGNVVVTSFFVNVTGSTPAYTVVVSASNPSPGIGQTVVFNASAIYNSNYPASFRAGSFDYVFSFGDGTPNVIVSSVLAGLNATAIHAFQSSGTFIVKVVAKERNYYGGRAVSQIQENGFLALPEVCTSGVPCSFTVGPVSPTAGQSTTFTATASGGAAPYTFSWDFGDGSTGNGLSVMHTYAKAGTYNVTLTIKDSTGETQIVKKTVTVAPVGGSFPLTLALVGIGAVAAAVLGSLFYLGRRKRKQAIRPLATPGVS